MDREVAEIICQIIEHSILDGETDEFYYVDPDEMARYSRAARVELLRILVDMIGVEQ